MHPSIRHRRARRGLLPCLLCIALLGQRVDAQEPRLRIVAGPIAPGADGLSGSFRIIEDDNGLASVGTGGACLVMRSGGWFGRGASCRADADCTVNAGQPDGHGYCLDRSRNTGRGRCWVRPGPAEAYCLLFKQTPAPIGETLHFPRDADGTPRPALSAPAGSWRVHACLNGRAPRACADPAQTDKQLDDGVPSRHRGARDH